MKNDNNNKMLLITYNIFIIASNNMLFDQN
jgi:hypothetical protein